MMYRSQMVNGDSVACFCTGKSVEPHEPCTKNPDTQESQGPDGQ